MVKCLNDSYRISHSDKLLYIKTYANEFKCIVVILIFKGRNVWYLQKYGGGGIILWLVTLGYLPPIFFFNYLPGYYIKHFKNKIKDVGRGCKIMKNLANLRHVWFFNPDSVFF